MPMQRLARDAQTVNETAQRIAQEYEQEYVGTEHILLAVARERECAAAKVLARLGVDEKKAKATIDALIEKSKEDTWVFGRLPGSPHFKNVVALAIEECQQLEAKTVGSEHLLLGLLRERGCIAERALHKMGVTLKAAREEVVKLASAER